jgi:hypothetical protein
MSRYQVLRDRRLTLVAADGEAIVRVRAFACAHVQRADSSNSELQETLFRRPTLRDRRCAYIVSERYPLGG